MDSFYGSKKLSKTLLVLPKGIRLSQTITKTNNLKKRFFQVCFSLSILMFLNGCTKVLSQYHKNLIERPEEFQSGCQEKCLVHQAIPKFPTGLYLGTTTKRNHTYHAFVFPDLLKGEHRGKLEVFIPVKKISNEPTIVSETHEWRQEGSPAVLYIVDPRKMSYIPKYSGTNTLVGWVEKEAESDYFHRMEHEKEFSPVLPVLYLPLHYKKSTRMSWKDFSQNNREVRWTTSNVQISLQGWRKNQMIVVLTSPGYLIAVPVDVTGKVIKKAYEGIYFFLCLLFGCDLFN